MMRRALPEAELQGDLMFDCRSWESIICFLFHMKFLHQVVSKIFAIY